MDVQVKRSDSESGISAEVMQGISEQISRRTGGRIRDLQLEVADGVIKLRGTTTRFYYKQLATSVVFESEIDLELDNEISVGIR